MLGMYKSSNIPRHNKRINPQEILWCENEIPGKKGCTHGELTDYCQLAIFVIEYLIVLL